MAEARTYDVTLGFKQTFMPYYGDGGIFGPYHHGIDYGAPRGSTVIVSDKTIGLSGDTGVGVGPHLHVDRRPIGTPITDRTAYKVPGWWWKIQGTVVKAEYAGTAGNMIAIQADNGDEYRFLHLSKINVKVGERIGKTMPKPTRQEVVTAFTVVRAGMSEKQAKYYQNNDVAVLRRDLRAVHDRKVANATDTLWAKIKAIFGK